MSRKVWRQAEGGSQRYKAFYYPWPMRCDLCGKECKDLFIDGRTKIGPWANMCTSCHASYGSGLGIGKGQQYVLEEEDETEQERISKS